MKFLARIFHFVSLSVYALTAPPADQDPSPPTTTSRSLTRVPELDWSKWKPDVTKLLEVPEPVLESDVSFVLPHRGRTLHFPLTKKITEEESFQLFWSPGLTPKTTFPGFILLRPRESSYLRNFGKYVENSLKVHDYLDYAFTPTPAAKVVDGLLEDKSDCPWMIFELTGVNLATRWKQRGRSLTLEERYVDIKKITDALMGVQKSLLLSEHGFIGRYPHPTNVMVPLEGEVTESNVRLMAYDRIRTKDEIKTLSSYATDPRLAKYIEDVNKQMFICQLIIIGWMPPEQKAELEERYKDRHGSKLDCDTFNPDAEKDDDVKWDNPVPEIHGNKITWNFEEE